MNVLTKDDAAAVMNVEALDFWLHQLAGQLKPVGDAFRIPKEAKAQTALAKLLAYLLLQSTGVYIYLSRWSQHPPSEHLELFYAYRRSMGENRPLSEAPVHYFDPATREQLVSILCLMFYFGWDAWIFDANAKTLVRLTRERGLEVGAEGATDIGAFAADPERYFTPLAS
jgi:hypothetical protein